MAYKKPKKSERGSGYYPHEFESLSEVITGIIADFKKISNYMDRDYKIIKKLSSKHSTIFNEYWTSCLHVINELLSRIEFKGTKQNRIYNPMYLWSALKLNKLKIPQYTNFELRIINSKLLENIEENISQYSDKYDDIITKEVYCSAQTNMNVMCICNHMRHKVNELLWRCKVEQDNQIIMELS